MKTTYVIMKNSDLTEGRGASVPTDISFTTYESAVEFCRSEHYAKYSVMGCLRAKDAEMHVRKVSTYQSVSEYTAQEPILRKENAMKKATEYLTRQELIDLGLIK